MEILFPDNSNFADLRRLYVDHDLSSMFRLLMEDNPPDIEDLKKFVLGYDVWSMHRILKGFEDTQLLKAIKSFEISDIKINDDALSQGQLKSKMWLVTELKRMNLQLGTVFLCAGWYGILSVLIFEHKLSITKLRSFDIDPDVTFIADTFNRPWVIDNWKFKAIEEDIHNISFSTHVWSETNSKGELITVTDSPNTIINTSCEHIENFDEWYARIPPGKLVVLQGNNFVDIDEHVNTHNTLDEFAAHTPMTQLLYSGNLALGEYTRYMRIGYR
jgi:hypothetical protein